MSNRIHELREGDVIRHRRGTTRYRVAGFNEHPAGLSQGELYVYLASETDKPGDYTLRRTFEQITKNWRLETAQ